MHAGTNAGKLFPWLALPVQNGHVHMGEVICFDASCLSQG